MYSGNTLPPQSDASGVLFSNNRTIPVNFREYSGAFDYNEEMDMYVFGTVGGSLAYQSPRFSFEVDNPIEEQRIRCLHFADYKGLIVSLSGQHVQVWDVFFNPVREQYVHRVIHAGKPSAICRLPLTKSFLIGTAEGKIHLMDTVQCSGDSKYHASSFFSSVSSGVTFLTTFDDEYCLVGTQEGVVKVMSLRSKKCVGQLKPPTSAPVEAVSVIPSRVFPVVRSFVVTYAGQSLVVVFGSNFSLLVTVPTPFPVLRAFALSTDTARDHLLVHTVDNRLVAMSGDKWGAEWRDILPESTVCLSLHPSPDWSTFTTMESTRSGLSCVVDRNYQKKIRTRWGSGGESDNATPIVFLPNQESRTENNLVRLANMLQNRPLSENFYKEWQAGQVEGVYVGITGNELNWVLYSNSAMYCIGSTPLGEQRDLEIVSAVDVMSMEGTDRWRVLLGYTSGRVVVLESMLGLKWQNGVTMEGVSQVHYGSRIKKIQYVFDECILSVDVNGMCAFCSISNPAEASHVAIAGEGGTCFTSATHAFVCMSDGTVERIRGPRKSVEESRDTEAWETEPAFEQPLPLEGEFVEFSVKERIAVRQTGYVHVVVGTKNTGSIGAAVRFPEATDSSFIHTARITSDHVVLFSKLHVWIYDIRKDVCVFTRDWTASLMYLSPSMHVIVPGVSITSLLYKDRTKEMHATGPVIEAAQKIYSFMEPIEREEEAIPEKPAKPSKYDPTADQLDQAREQLRRNLEDVEKLEDDAARMQDQSEEFLRNATQLNAPKKKGFWRKLFS
jgi:hypothetical protein